MFGKSCHCTLSKVCIVAAVSRNKDVSLGPPRTKEPKVRKNDVERHLLVLPVLALGFDTLSIPFGFCTMIRKGAIARFWQFGGPECRSGGWLLPWRTSHDAPRRSFIMGVMGFWACSWDHLIRP